MDKKVDVTIEDYGYFGEGVGKARGKVCFIPCTIIGEKVEGIVKKENSTFCKCAVKRILTPSPLRQNAPCPYYTKCGGCAYQHVSYKTELQIKATIAERQLKKVGFEGNVQIVPSSQEYFYRNKIKLFCNNGKLALCESSSNRLVPIEECLIVDKKINHIIKLIQSFIDAKNISKNIKNVYIRINEDQSLVWFVLKRKMEIDFQGLQLMLGAKNGIFMSVANDFPAHVLGICQLSQEEHGLKCTFNVNSFHQVNQGVAEKLYNFVAEKIKAMQVVNCYSGAGVLSAILAKNNKRVYGIELGRAEHQDAEKLKSENKLGNLFNICGDCAKQLPKLLTKSTQCVVVDPPRAGISTQVCQAIDNSFVKLLVYISCESSSLVRDIARLKNFKIESATLFDMFPKTSSFELVCLLKRKED